MSDLRSKIIRFEKWKNTERVMKSIATPYFSNNRLIFFTFRDPHGGNFADILDLEKVEERNLVDAMEKHLKHMEEVGNKILTKNRRLSL